MEQFLQTVIDISTPVVIALLGLGATYLISFINKIKAKTLAETEKIQNEKQRQLVNGAIEDLDKLLLQNIMVAENTLVKEIKKATEDNKLSVEEGQEIANAVVNDVMNQLTTDSKQLLANQSSNLEKYIRDEIEVILQQIKDKTNNI